MNATMNAVGDALSPIDRCLRGVRPRNTDFLVPRANGTRRPGRSPRNTGQKHVPFPVSRLHGPGTQPRAGPDRGDASGRTAGTAVVADLILAHWMSSQPPRHDASATIGAIHGTHEHASSRPRAAREEGSAQGHGSQRERDPRCRGEVWWVEGRVLGTAGLVDSICFFLDPVASRELISGNRSAAAARRPLFIFFSDAHRSHRKTRVPPLLCVHGEKEEAHPIHGKEKQAPVQQRATRSAC